MPRVRGGCSHRARCEADLRCLDARAHLGNLDFDDRPGDAIRHHEVGIRIGELSLAPEFDGLLPWGYIDNRPFLRCMHGYGLCLWKLRRFEEAEGVFRRMLWLNPSDNQGVRFLTDEVRARTAWEDRREDAVLHEDVDVDEIALLRSGEDRRLL